MGLFRLSLPNYGLIGLTLALAYYVRYKWKHSFFKDQGIPGPTPWPIFGTLLGGFTKGFREMDLNFIRQYGPTIGLYERGDRVLLTCDEDLLREILVKDFNNFINRQTEDSSCRGVEPILKKLMTSLRDDEWKRVRSLLTPTFSTGKLKQMTYSINECSSLFVSRLEKTAEDNEEFDVKSFSSDFSMDVIGRAAFGLQTDSQTGESAMNEFVVMAKKSMDVRFTNPIVLCAVFCPFLVPFLLKLGFTLIDAKSMNFFTSVVDQAMANRPTGDKSRQDFLQLMANAHKDEYDANEVAQEAAKDGIIFDDTKIDKKGLSKLEILAQGFIFFSAGYETVSNAISVLLHCLATHPDIQRRVQEEVDAAFGEKDVLDYQDTQKLIYLDQCFNESLRLYYPMPRLEREVARDVTLKGIRLVKGMRVGISVSGRHMDPNIWPEPEKFDPERFSAENRVHHGPFDHLPFGYGPRNCIAMRLAYMEVKMVAAHIVRHYTLCPGPKTQIPLRFNKMMKFENGVWLKAEKR